MNSSDAGLVSRRSGGVLKVATDSGIRPAARNSVTAARQVRAARTPCAGAAGTAGAGRDATAAECAGAAAAGISR